MDSKSYLYREYILKLRGFYPQILWINFINKLHTSVGLYLHYADNSESIKPSTSPSKPLAKSVSNTQSNRQLCKASPREVDGLIVSGGNLDIILKTIKRKRK